MCKRRLDTEHYKLDCNTHENVNSFIEYRYNWKELDKLVVK